MPIGGKRPLFKSDSLSVQAANRLDSTVESESAVNYSWALNHRPACRK
jgi:hypothetical protein